MDLPCSRNARSKTPLVGRAQWKIHQPPSLEERTSELGWAAGCQSREKQRGHPTFFGAGLGLRAEVTG